MGSKLHSGLIRRFSANGKYAREAGNFLTCLLVSKLSGTNSEVKTQKCLCLSYPQGITDFIIFPTEQLCKFPIS